MKENLFIKKGYNKDEVIQTGHQFLLGNGHIGYRGTLEEYTKEDMVGFNLVGVYDQYQDKWRESLNLPNPLFCKICREEKEISVKQSKYKKHEIQLDITNGLFKRITKYNDLIFSSTRFITFDSDLLIEKITIKTLKTLNLKIRMGLDTDIYESNGPHYVNKEVENIGNDIIFIGTTNEGKKIYQRNKYLLPENLKKRYLDGGFDIFYVSHGKEELTFYIASKVVNSKEEDFDFDYQKEYENHLLTFKKKWENSLIELKGNKEISFALKYSVYHLLILGDEYRNNSIPARGVSGQVYK